MSMLFSSVTSIFKASKPLSTVQKGRLCEEWAVRFLQQKGYTVESRNLRTPYAEIDILLKHPHKQNLTVVEVKKTHPQSGEIRLSSTQKNRLIRACCYLEQTYKQPVEFYLVLVGATPRSCRLVPLDTIVT